ncbi:MAG TPA: 4-alpha-glucanotransferase [Chthoniobacterales bacterium]|jgi:4-alpha-glucanotransferase|nr:4-alpha-glucanotransferase [Chthoniobacterales bacterium]
MSIPLFNWLKDRSAGVLLHPTSLPGSTGIGTLGREARHFIDFLVDAGLKYWQVFPLGPTGFGDSPYQCFSAFAGNPYFIDLETLVGQHYLEENDLAELRRLPADRVDYGAQWVLRWPILRKAYQAFTADASRADKADFAAFRKNHKDWLEAYARFIALKGKYDGSSWQLWPSGVRQYSKVRKSSVKSELSEEIDAQAWFQFEFFRQWLELKSYANTRGVQIFGDIPIFVAMDSSDVWTHPTLFQMDDDLRPTAVAGVPPDYFAAEGQLWGNPLYDWDKHHATNYAWWLSRLRASFQLYDVVRIDHFRGFDEYCRIPASAINALHYKWVKGPGLALFEAIHKEFPDAKLVAEDLGIITDSVRALVEATGVPGMKVLQFGFEGATEYLPHNGVPNSVLYPGTHDNDTAWGWFSKQSEPVKDFFRQYLRAPGDAVPWDMVRAGYAAPSRLFIVPMQDLLSLGSESRMNTPGQAVGNWHWRFTRERLDQLWNESGEYLRLLAKLYER